MSKPPGPIGRARESVQRRFRRFLLKRIALPIVNSELRKQGVRFHRYVESADRLAPVDRLSWRALDRRHAGAIPSDDWYQVLKDRAIDTDVIFDVGAGFGSSSAWFSEWAAKVIVFEPYPANAERVREHHRIRRVKNAEIVEAAVSDHDGEATLYVKPYAGHHSLGDIGASSTMERIQVPVVTLDHVAEERGIDHVGLLKIDVEGFEPEVLEGARGLLSDRAVDLILFEYSPMFYRQRGIDVLAPILDLERIGYRVTSLDGTPVVHADVASKRQLDLIAEPAPG